MKTRTGEYAGISFGLPALERVQGNVHVDFAAFQRAECHFSPIEVEGDMEIYLSPGDGVGPFYKTRRVGGTLRVHSGYSVYGIFPSLESAGGLELANNLNILYGFESLETVTGAIVLTNLSRVGFPVVTGVRALTIVDGPKRMSSLPAVMTSEAEPLASLRLVNTAVTRLVDPSSGEPRFALTPDAQLTIRDNERLEESELCAFISAVRSRGYLATADLGDISCTEPQDQRALSLR